MKIDVSKVGEVEELHMILKEELDFPDFYGMNWSAFWDTIAGLVELPEKIEFIGWKEMEGKIPDACKKLVELLSNYNEKFPKWKCDVMYI